MGSENSPNDGPLRIAFADYTLDLERGSLMGPDGEVHLRPQAYRLLEVLIDSAPRVVPHDELMDRAWGTEHLSASVLKQTVSELRQALGDRAAKPTYIATVPRRGYRFIAPLQRQTSPLRRQLESAPPATTAPVEKSAEVGQVTPLVQAGDASSARRLRWAGGLVVLLLLALAFWYFGRDEPVAQRPAVAILGFVDLAGQDSASGREFEWIGTALEELVGLDIVASGHFRWISGESVAAMQRDLALGEKIPSQQNLQRIRRYSGADLVLRGSYLAPAGGGGPLEVQLLVLDARSGEALAAVQSAAAFEDLIPLAHRLVRRLWSELGVVGETVVDLGPEHLRAALPSHSGALKLYAEGIREARRMEWQEARRLLQAAADLDGSSPVVHAALAEAWDRLGFDRRAAEEAARATELAVDLPVPTRLVIEARALDIQGRPEAEQAYEMLWRLHGDDPEVALALAAIQMGSGQLEVARSTLAEAYGSSSVDPKDPRFELMAARLAFEAGDVAEGFELARSAAEEAEFRGAWQIVAAAEVAICWANYRAGEFEAAIAAVRTAVELYEKGSNRAAAAAARATLATFLEVSGRSEEASLLFDTAISTLAEVGDRSREATVRNNFASHLANRGQVPAAIEQLMRSREIAREVGDLDSLATTTINIAEVHRNRGELAAARRLVEEVLDLRSRLDDPYRVALALRVRARLELAAGRFEQARRDYEDALGLFSKAGATLWTHRVEKQLGFLAFDRGKAAIAAAYLQDAAQGFEAIGDPQQEFEARTGLAWMELRVGHLTTAAEQAQQILTAADGLAEPLASRVRALGWFLTAELSRIDNRVEDARAQLEEVLRLRRQQQDLLEEAATRLALVRLDLDSGRATGVAEKLAELASSTVAESTVALRLEAAALRVRALAVTGDCEQARQLSRQYRPQLPSLRKFARLQLGLDFEQAAMACGEPSQLIELAQQAEALGYLGLELRARGLQAQLDNDSEALAAVAHQAAAAGFHWLATSGVTKAEPPPL